MSTHVLFTFVDKSGKQAVCRLHVHPVHDHGAALTLAGWAAPQLAALSNAHLATVRISHSLPLAGTPPAQPGSSVYRTGLLFYRNGNGTASISLPSIRRLLAESSGRYAGVRITRASLDVLNLLDAVDGLLGGALDPAGRPYGGAFSVGCIQEEQP